MNNPPPPNYPPNPNTQNNPSNPNTPKEPSKKPSERESKPDDALQRQLNEIKRREHDKHLSTYRKPNPNAPWGS